MHDPQPCISRHDPSPALQVLVLAHVTAAVVDLTRHDAEKSFPTAPGWKELLPSIYDPASRELSVIVPAYNEELRSESSSHDQEPRWFLVSLRSVFCGVLGSI